MMRSALLWLFLLSGSAFAYEADSVVGWLRSGDRCMSVSAAGRVLPASMSSCSGRGSDRPVKLENFNFPSEVKSRPVANDDFKLTIDPPSARRRLGWFPLD